MKKNLKYLTLLLLCTQVAFAQLKIKGKGIIGGDIMPSDVFQVNGDMQLEEPSPFLRLKTSTGANSGFNWKNAADANIGAFFLEPSSGNFFFDINGFSTTGATAEFTFDADGELGIGYNNPQAPLHILNENAELARLESMNSSKWIAFYQNGARKGRLWNLENNLVLDTEETTGQIQLQIGGTPQVIVGTGGDLMARTTSRRATFTFAHPNGAGTNTGLTLLNDGGSGNYWNLYTVGNTGNFELFQNGVFKGRFLASDGSYTPTSDKNYKSNIQTIDKVLDRIRLLQPKTYTMKHDKRGSEHIGFIAQEVEEVFPQMVYLGPVGDTEEQAYTMNYNSMTVVAIKGIQELMGREDALEEEQAAVKEEVAALQQENRLLKRDLEDMGAQVQKMKDILDRVAQMQENCCRIQEGDAVDLKSVETSVRLGLKAELRQNIPNPFVLESSISYFIPEIRNQAFLRISDINGRLLKEVNIREAGEGILTLNTQNLPAGTYAYALFVDGELIETRQMLILNR